MPRAVAPLRVGTSTAAGTCSRLASTPSATRWAGRIRPVPGRVARHLADRPETLAFVSGDIDEAHLDRESKPGRWAAPGQGPDGGDLGDGRNQA